MCFKQWWHRKQKLLGKFIVIKTFALPNFFYSLSVLSNPPNNTLPEINIFKFIWENKPDKIKRSRLKMPFNAGLNVLDIFNYNRSLKAGWIKRYLDKIIMVYGKQFFFKLTAKGGRCSYIGIQYKRIWYALLI